MNLIEDPWIPIIRQDGQNEKIAPWQIVETQNPVMEINAPRPDFQGALYQFLIGLLQTAFAPEDHDEWLEYWDTMPTQDELKTCFNALAPAFILDHADGPAFMQDLDLKTGEPKSIGALLIDAPGGKTSKDNLDHFIKRDMATQFCHACAATALFTLQLNAPSGGVGHRVGLRGGGPLTTLALPYEKSPLWRTIWLNVLDAESFCGRIQHTDPLLFPWLGGTRVSDKHGVETHPENGHPLQMFWGMPRRIRLDIKRVHKGTCDLCGAEDENVFVAYQTQNYGTNYTGAWIHPLSPYRFDPKKQKPPLSLKGQQGGLGYQHWLGLVMTDPYNGDCAAKVTAAYMESRSRDIDALKIARLWCFGYDMDNMKARCWYDHVFPLFHIDATQRDNLLVWASDLIHAARETANLLKYQIKKAWFRRPSDVKGDMNVVVFEFWQNSERQFFNILEKLVTLPGSQKQIPAQCCTDWLKTIRTLAFQLFDAWALEAPAEDMDMKRIINAREELRKKFNTNKAVKQLAQKAKVEKESS